MKRIMRFWYQLGLIAWLISGCSAPLVPVRGEVFSVGNAVPRGNTDMLVARTISETVCNCGASTSNIIKKVEESYAAQHVVTWELESSAGAGAEVGLLGTGVDISAALAATYGNEWASTRTRSVGFDLSLVRVCRLAIRWEGRSAN